MFGKVVGPPPQDPDRGDLRLLLRASLLEPSENQRHSVAGHVLDGTPRRADQSLEGESSPRRCEQLTNEFQVLAVLPCWAGGGPRQVRQCRSHFRSLLHAIVHESRHHPRLQHRQPMGPDLREEIRGQALIDVEQAVRHDVVHAIPMGPVEGIGDGGIDRVERIRGVSDLVDGEGVVGDVQEQLERSATASNLLQLHDEPTRGLRPKGDPRRAPEDEVSPRMLLEPAACLLSHL